MIILKKTHEAFLSLKDQQIAALQEEVKWLRHCVQPAPYRPVVIQQEADAVLEGRQEQLTDEQVKAAQDLMSERDRVLSGTY